MIAVGCIILGDVTTPHLIDLMISLNVADSDRRASWGRGRDRRFAEKPANIMAVLKLALLLIPMAMMVAGADEAGADTLPPWATENCIADRDNRVEVLKTEDVFLRSEASMILVDLIRQAVSDRTDEVLGAGGHRYVPLTDQYIQRHLVDEEMVIEKVAVDPVTAKQTLRHQGFARLRFDGNFELEVRQMYHLNLQIRRLQWAGLVAIMGLSWLATVYSYLRLDHATRHFYSRRLQTMAILSCLIPLVLATWMAVAWGLL